MTPAVEEDAGAQLRARGWHQGSVISVSAELAELVGEGVAYALVASQDCDVVASSTNEPNIDLLPAVVGEAPHGDWEHGKNPRRLCLPLIDGRFAAVDIRQRVTVPKEAATTSAPLVDAAVRPSAIKVFAKWLGKRYSRPAFPDSFNRRIGNQKKRFDRLSKRQDSREVTAVFLSLNTEDELGQGESYELVVWFACRTAVAEEPGSRARLEKYAEDFTDALAACDGIDVAEYEVIAHFDITLEDLERMKRFDFDFRSDAIVPGGEAVSEP